MPSTPPEPQAPTPLGVFVSDLTLERSIAELQRDLEGIEELVGQDLIAAIRSEYPAVDYEEIISMPENRARFEQLRESLLSSYREKFTARLEILRKLQQLKAAS